MFRDLSNKLFTSEIIELHDKQREDYHSDSRKQELTNSSETSGPMPSSSHVTIKKTSKKASSNPALEDLGKLFCALCHSFSYFNVLHCIIHDFQFDLIVDLYNLSLCVKRS